MATRPYQVRREDCSPEEFDYLMDTLFPRVFELRKIARARLAQKGSPNSGEARPAIVC